MNPRTIASVAAVVGGAGWIAKVGLIWLNGGHDTSTRPVEAMYVLGFVGIFVALAAAGYTLVEKAPVWLRAVVGIATPLLVLMLWLLLDQAIKAVYTKDTWFREEINVILAGVIAVVLGLWEARRYRPVVVPAHAAPVRGRRAAR